jgi:hypothetical protein
MLGDDYTNWSCTSALNTTVVKQAFILVSEFLEVIVYT